MVGSRLIYFLALAGLLSRSSSTGITLTPPLPRKACLPGLSSLARNAYCVCCERRTVAWFLPQETVGFFLYSASLLPTHGFPFYNIGWTLQHEITFYLIATLIVPWLGLRGLTGLLFLSVTLGRYFDLHGPGRASQPSRRVPGRCPGIHAQ